METQIDIEDLKESTNIDLLLDPNIKDVEPDIKLQDTAVDMQDFDDLETTYNAKQNFKMLFIGIVVFIVIVGGGLLFVFSGEELRQDAILPKRTLQPLKPSSDLPKLKQRN